MMQLHVDDVVISTREIMHSRPEYGDTVIPEGTTGRIGEWNLSAYYVYWDFEGTTPVWVDRDAFEPADIYWKKRAMKAETILDNLASLVAFEFDGCVIAGKSLKRVK